MCDAWHRRIFFKFYILIASWAVLVPDDDN
jgi:hypothetical protein